MSKPSRLYSSSSEEEDDQDNYIPRQEGQKSALFTFKRGPVAITEDKNEQLDESREQEEEERFEMKPKLKPAKENVMGNGSTLYNKSSLTEKQVSQKEIVAAYTFKLKSPAVTRKKKSDPVALFQQTSTLWRKDKFLTSRGNNKEGRKLDLDKRNKEAKLVA